MCHPGMMGGMGSAGGGSSAFLLIAMALGYWVLTLADNNADPLKLIGRIVGWIVMIVALSGLVCGTMHRMCGQKMMMKHAGGCPMMSGGCDSEKMEHADDKSAASIEKEKKPQNH